MRRVSWGVFALVLLVPLHLVLAASSGSTYTIIQRIGSDTVPPTVPTNLVATPVATSQIHLTWTPSTDNQTVAGYQVYRDGVQIATTPQTIFDDVGLTAGTTYTYQVRAYDESHNVSSSSVAVATTTFALPVAPAPAAAATSSLLHTGGQVTVRLGAFTVTTASSSATFTWTTSGFVESELHWGITSPYDLGYVRNQSLQRQHLTTITDLEPGRTYQYQLTAILATGRTVILKQGTFTTVGRAALASPLNVSALRAAVVGNDVHLSWHNPVGVSISKLRIVRNFMFYPADPGNGMIVFEGAGSSFVDHRALTSYRHQYYTVFLYDSNGNVSSGAIVEAAVAGTSTSPVTVAKPISTTSASTTGGAPATMTGHASISTTFGDFYIVQHNQVYAPVNGTFRITNELPILVQVPYGKVPEHLKTIIMTVDGNSYIMRVSKNGQTYEAYIPAVGVGKHHLEFAIYDFQTSVLKRLDGMLVVNAFLPPVVPGLVTTVGGWATDHPTIIATSVFALLVLLFVYFRAHFDIVWRSLR